MNRKSRFVWVGLLALPAIYFDSEPPVAAVWYDTSSLKMRNFAGGGRSSKFATKEKLKFKAKIVFDCAT